VRERQQYDQGQSSNGSSVMRHAALIVGLTLSLAGTPVASATVVSSPPVTAAVAHELGYSLTPSTTEPYAACPPPTPGHAQCFALITPTSAVKGLSPAGAMALEGGGEDKGWAPTELREAYNVPEKGGSGQTVAIVDAYDDPHANADLKAYRERYKLPACTEENGCFKRMNQSGEKANYPEAPPPGSRWPMEISIDVDMVSAACPECHIALIEADSEELSDLYLAQRTAASGPVEATEISDSWGGAEESNEWENDEAFNHKNVPTVVASGDAGGKFAFYPATSKYVIAVGATWLKRVEKTAENPRGWEERVWAGTSGGCSAFEAKPSWQSDWSCPMRTDNDVAAVGSTESSVSVYDQGWTLGAGTSVAAPLIAGIEAHASKAVREEPGGEAFYRHSMFDVTLGADAWNCNVTYMCTAEEGYDSPTGWGSVNGPLESTPGFHAVTGGPASVGKSEATLNGWVQPEGLETSYHFEYGQSTSYGKVMPVPNASAGSGHLWKAVSQAVTGLEEDQLYHYRLVASNSSGTVYGLDQTLTTDPWTVQSTPLPSEYSEANYSVSLSGVSCSATTSCTSVGSYENSAKAEVTLAERWNGSAWTQQSSANPTGGSNDRLTNVSCAASTGCMAVGFYTSGSTIITLAEQWNGSSWTIKTTPNPEGSLGSELLSVSCTSTTACTAVGRYYLKKGKTGKPEYLPMIERWSSEKWVLQTAPSPEGSQYGELHGVACPSPEVCVAVGSLTSSSGNAAALRWNGTEWTSQEMSSAVTKLAGVSCWTTEACTAVGGGLGAPTAARWSNKEWTVEAMPSPIGPKESNLYGNGGLVEAVSCSGPTQCIAVGRVSREAEGTTMAELWNGSQWSTQGAPRPNEGMLFAIACATSINCTTVGSFHGYNYKESLHTAALAESASLPPIGKPSLETTTATNTTAAGATLGAVVDAEGATTAYHFEYGLEKGKYETSSSEVGVGFYRVKVPVTQPVTGLTLGTTYHFRVVATNALGTVYGEDHAFTTAVWGLESFPSPSSAKWTAPRELSCVSSTECIAVGAYQSSTSVETPLAEKWNGAAWATQTAAVPSGALWSALADVSCTSSTACTAVGRYENSSKTEVTLAERWNGSEWVVQSTPNPSGAKSSWLEAVSCTSSTACTAVGRYENSSKTEVTLAERWNGSEWVVQSTPNPSGAKWSRLADVSCSATLTCTAVGSDENSSGVRVTLAESWNGSEWTILSTPNPGGAEWSSLKGISCPNGECVAVGSYRAGGKYSMLEEKLASVWSIQPPGEAKSGQLLAISCPSIGWCSATGTNEAKEPLTEHWNGSEWAQQQSSIPATGTVAVLEGVACTTICVAAGYSYENPESPSGLGESYPLRAPYAKTQPAGNVGETQGTIRGIVNPSGSETKYLLEYGPTAAYGTKTTEVGVGAGMGNLEESTTVTGLAVGSSTHFRIVAKSAKGTSYGEDQTFITGMPGDLGAMATTDPFNATNSAISNFASNWGTLGWVSEKGSDRTTGWGPIVGYPTVAGAYYAPSIPEGGAGTAVEMTMAETPGAEARYFSLWLDMPNPSAGTRSGYELRFTYVPSAIYEVKLSKWVSGTQTVLATKSGYGLANGNSLALVDQGGTVSAWVNTGSGFGELLNAGDTTFEGGEAGVEGSGNIMRLTNFKVGQLLIPVANMSTALNALPLKDSFATNETPLSDGGAFSALAWDNGTSLNKTGWVEGGWGAYDAYPAIDGAYWSRSSFADTGWGDAVSATLSASPASTSRYFSLWLNMPSPGSARSGYELRFTERSPGVYEVDLSKWVSGVETILASKASYTFPTKSRFALVELNGTVSAWTSTGSEYTQILTASDGTYASGYLGVDASGNSSRLTELKGGPLPPS
jgi:hypothetical protein